MNETTLNSINGLHFQLKAHSDILSDKALRSLWIEVPDHCQLQCPYCFANTLRNNPHSEADILHAEEYLSLIETFRGLGGQFLGIPGLGEPFHPANRELVLSIIERASQIGLQITVFTTGEAIFWNMDPQRSYAEVVHEPADFSCADRLVQSNVILLVKVNSLDSRVQDRLVSQPGYTAARDKALFWLMNKYHLNRERRLGIVTSIIPDNVEEIDRLYTFAYQKDLIFDCDTILPRGRGHSYQRTHCVTPQELRMTFHNIIRSLPGRPSRGGSYIGSSCDRINHHLYVDVRGNVYPCIGCVGREEHLNLGNIRNRSLSDIWDDPLRRDLRDNYPSNVLGVCSYCENFTRECHSCLGRWVKKIESFASGPVIHTTGCFNHKPDLNLWMTRCAKFIRSRISSSSLEIRQSIRTDIEKYGLEVFWKCLPAELVRFDITNRFPRIQKDITYTDLDTPFSRVWDLIDMDTHAMGVDKRDVVDSLIPRTLLPSLRLLADKYDQGFDPSPEGLDKSSKGNIQFCNLMFYQHHMKRGFYRTVAYNALDCHVLRHPKHQRFASEHPEVFESLQNELEIRNRKVRLWQRWVETFEDQSGAIGLLVPHIADFSKLMEEDRVDTYELILSETLFQRNRLAIHNDIVNGGECVLNVAPMLDSPLIQNRLRMAHDLVQEVVGDAGKWKKIEQVLSSVVFAYAGNDLAEPIQSLKVLFAEMTTQTFFSPMSEKKISSNELDAIQAELERIIREVLISQITMPQATLEIERRLASEIREIIFSASWADVCNALRELMDSRKNNNARVPDLLSGVFDREDASAIKCLHNPVFLHFVFLFIEENATGVKWSPTWLKATNYFIWLGFFRDYCDIQCYLAHYAPNLRLHLNILTSQKINHSSPSGMILGSTDRLSREAKQAYERLYDFVMNPFEEILQTEYMTSETSKHHEDRRNLELAETAYAVGHTQKDRFTRMLNALEFAQGYLSGKRANVPQSLSHLSRAQVSCEKAIASATTIDFMANLFHVDAKIEHVDGKWLVPGPYVIADHLNSELYSLDASLKADLEGVAGFEIAPNLRSSTRRLFDEFYDDIFSELISNAVSRKASLLEIGFDTIKVLSDAGDDQYACLIFTNTMNEHNFEERLKLKEGAWSMWPISRDGPKGALRQIAIRLKATRQGHLFAKPERHADNWLFSVALHLVGLNKP